MMTDSNESSAIQQASNGGYKPEEFRLTTTLSVPLTASQAEQVRTVSRRSGQSASAWIRNLIDRALSSVPQPEPARNG